MEWIRGGQVGRGAFATVDLAIPNPSSSPIDPPLPSMVVKSADFSMSDSLRNEREILSRLGGGCQQIVQYLGDARTAENGRDLYNLFFEYAAGGSLADRLKKTSGNRFPDPELRRITNSILKGLVHVHDRGFVHCDVKLQNVLVFADGGVKIADFGLAKERVSKKGSRFELRGTPLYMAPEVVAGGEVDAPADVWAVGCAVVEMATGSPAWRCDPGCGVGELLCRIGGGNSAPEIPGSLGEEGRDFVAKCFRKDPKERWTARMLLDHPFVSGSGEEEEEEEESVCDCDTTSSPRGPFEFAEWTPTACNSEASWECSEEPCSGSVLDRVEGLVGEPVCEPDWSDADGWLTIRLDC